MNRREFSKKLTALAGAAYPLLSAAHPVIQGAPTFSSLSQSIKDAAGRGLRSHAVYDARLAFQSVALRQQLGTVDELHTYHGDVTSIWYQLLDPLWAQGKIVTGGITRHSEFFLLRTLACERDHHVSYVDEYKEHVIWLIEPAGASLG